MKAVQLIGVLLIITFSFSLKAQTIPNEFTNPVLSGFNPDPSICRVNDDYYMVTSSFTWYPGIPIYHSKDLVNWELVGHGINRPGMISLKKVNDNEGIWAVTIRYYDGLFYLITNCRKCGGNFYITAKNPKGPWSDPVWLKDAPGVDPSLFWDKDGKCYYTGNQWGGFKKSWPHQTAIWIQELDLHRKKLVGKRKILTYGYAGNAAYAEAPHIYKVNNKYVLIMAEGGTDYYHAVTAFKSDSLFGPYVADRVNPVLSHRQLGREYPIQAVGHADLVQTQKGEWYAVCLGKRMIEGQNPLSRETFLCQVKFENSTPIFNPGFGKVLLQQKRPDLPWAPIQDLNGKDDFDSENLALKWHFVKIPAKKFYKLEDGSLHLFLQPETVDSLTYADMILQKVKDLHYTAIAKLNFRTDKRNEAAGMILYRTANGYYSLMKNKQGIVLTKKYLGRKSVIKKMPYKKEEVYLKVEANGINVRFGFGATPDEITHIGGKQSLKVISDNKFNRFNGPGIGLYATGNGKQSKNKATYGWFEYKADK